MQTEARKYRREGKKVTNTLNSNQWEEKKGRTKGKNSCGRKNRNGVYRLGFKRRKARDEEGRVLEEGGEKPGFALGAKRSIMAHLGT